MSSSEQNPASNDSKRSRDIDVRALELFEAALDVDEHDRNAWITTECGGNDQLRQKVLSLLGVDLHAGFLEFPGVDSPDVMPRALGEFEIEDQIGAGAMGVVYRARQQSLNRVVALKVLKSQLGQTPQARIRFLREVESVASLNHSAIVNVFTTGSENETLYYAMEFVDGPPLSDIIEYLCNTPTRELSDSSAVQSASNRPQTNLVPVVPAWAVEIFVADNIESDHHGSGYFDIVASLLADVADGLAAVHQENIVHRDIKPSNLLLSSDARLRISDFGLARNILLPTMTQTGDVVGTPFYMAPEQIRGSSHIDGRADIYALGATLFELLTLQPPFPGERRDEVLNRIVNEEPTSPRKINRRVPPDLETICLKSLEKEPQRRYQSAEQLAEDLRRFVRREPLVAKPSGFVDRSRKWVARHRALAWTLMLSMILGTFGVVAGSLIFAFEAKRHASDLEQAQRSEQEAHRGEREAFAKELEAHADSRARLYESLFRQAQAERLNRESGSRDEALQALTEAATLLPELRFSPDRANTERLLLRNEATAMLAEPGLIPDADFASTKYNRRLIGIDPTWSRYAWSGGDLEIRSFPDDETELKIPQHMHRATNAKFSSDGRYLATMHRRYEAPTKFVQVWDLVENRSVVVVETETVIFQFAPSSDAGQPPHLLVLSTDSTVTIYKACDETEPVQHEFPAHIRDACFSADGSTVSVVGDEQFVRLWEFDTGEERTLPVKRPLTAVAWNSPSGWMAVGASDGSIQILNPSNFDEVALELASQSGGVLDLAMTQDGAVVAASLQDGTTRFWNVHGRYEFQRLRNLTIRGSFSGTGVLDDAGSRLCGIDREGQLHWFRLKTKRPRHTYVSRPHIIERNDISFHPVHHHFAAVATGDDTELWDLAKRRMLYRLPTDRTHTVQFSADGNQLLTSARRGLTLWQVAVNNADSNISVVELQNLVPEHTYHAAADSKLKTVGYITRDGEVVVLDVAGGRAPKTLSGTKKSYRVAITPDGQQLIAMRPSEAGLPVYSTTTGEQLVDLAPKTISYSPTFSSDGRWLLATNTFDRTVWNTDDWQMKKCEKHTSYLLGVATFSPDARSVVVAHDPFRFALLDREKFSTLVHFETGHQRLAAKVEFSPDGRHLAILLHDRFDIWDMDELRSELQEMNLNW